MNCTSAVETVGSLALVFDGRVRVGFPGAPGWTTTGFDVPDCFEDTGRLAALDAESKQMHTATVDTNRISRVRTGQEGLSRRRYLRILGAHTITCRSEPDSDLLCESLCPLWLCGERVLITRGLRVASTRLTTESQRTQRLTEEIQVVEGPGKLHPLLGLRLARESQYENHQPDHAK